MSLKGVGVSFKINVYLLYVLYEETECGYAVTQLDEALRYKPEGRGFDSQWCHWYFSLTLSFRPYYGPGVYSASDRNEYQEWG